MAYIDLEDGLPGIIGLLEYRKDTAKPIRELTQILLRGDSSLSEAERELIAVIVSHQNECTFCATAHSAAADFLLGECTTTASIKKTLDSDLIDAKMQALLKIAAKVQKSGRLVAENDVLNARENGATDLEIHDTVLIAALFSLYNRYVDGLSASTPKNPEFYKTLAKRIVNKGYIRPPQGYSNLKYIETDD